MIGIRSKDAMVRPPVPECDNVPYRVHVLTTSAISAIAPMEKVARGVAGLPVDP